MFVHARLRKFISKMFIYAPMVYIKDVYLCPNPGGLYQRCLSILTGGRGRRRRSRGSRRSWTTGRTTATSTISPSDLDQCNWVEYLNYLTFWSLNCFWTWDAVNTATAISTISPSDIKRCSVSLSHLLIYLSAVYLKNSLPFWMLWIPMLWIPQLLI